MPTLRRMAAGDQRPVASRRPLAAGSRQQQPGQWPLAPGRWPAPWRCPTAGHPAICPPSHPTCSTRHHKKVRRNPSRSDQTGKSFLLTFFDLDLPHGRRRDQAVGQQGRRVPWPAELMIGLPAGSWLAGQATWRADRSCQGCSERSWT